MRFGNSSGQASDSLRLCVFALKPEGCRVRGRDGGRTMSDIEELAHQAIQCGLAIHRDLGPGLLESCYEVLLAAMLARAGFAVERQKVVDIDYKGISVREAFRADLIVERRLV